MTGDDLRDEARATERMVEIINHGWLNLVLSLGERLGLHEFLATSGPTSVTAIAAATGYDERYLDEWCWAMVAGGILSQKSGCFELRPEYRESTTAEGGPAHWSRISAQLVAMARIEDSVVEAFKTGDGLSSDLYEGRLVEVMASESGPIFETALLSEVLPLLGIADTLTAGGSVVDIGCGVGSALTILAGRFPNSQFTGIDQSRDAIASARRRADSAGLKNVKFEVADAEESLSTLLDLDLVMAANLVHDLSDPAKFFGKVRTILRPGGLLYIHELNATTDMAVNVQDPHALGMLGFSLYHCIPLAQRQKGVVPGPMWGRERYLDALASSGFSKIESHVAPSDPNNVTLIARA